MMAFTEPDVNGRPKVPNLVLRRIREEDRQESRCEFADALARVARELGEQVSPSERYVARLEDGDVRYPSPAYRRVLTELCKRPITELGFTPRYRARGGTAFGDGASGLTLSPQPGDTNYASPDRKSLLASDASGTLVPVRGALDSWLPASVHPADLVAASEWPVWFGIRLAHLIALVDNWQAPATQFDSLQALLHQEVLMFDATAPEGEHSVGALHALSRRQALVTLAALPLTLGPSGTTSAGTPGTAAATEFFLSRCAASLTACWHLLRGSDLPTVDQMLSTYLLALEGAAQQESRYQRAAARLASQAHRICGIVALHRNQLRVREHHCKRALYYATVASDTSSQASALISLASTYFYSSDPAQAAVIYEQASDLEADMPPLQRSRVYAELSVVYGQLRREQDAIRSARLAEQLYPDYPEQDRSFLYAEFTPASLTLEHGLAYVALADRRYSVIPSR